MTPPAATPPPERPYEPVTVTVTYTGDEAAVLHTLAVVEGRTPEEVAIDRIARGIPLVFETSVGEDPRVMEAIEAAMFDGPPDLSARAREGLFEESGR